jgi:hypothetical protein
MAARSTINNIFTLKLVTEKWVQRDKHMWHY